MNFIWLWYSFVCYRYPTSPRPPCTAPGPTAQVLGHLSLSHDLPLKCWDTSHCPKTSSYCPKTSSHCPKTYHSSVGTLRTVPRPPRTVPRPPRAVPGLTIHVLGHFALSQDFLVLSKDLLALSQVQPLKCWDTSNCPKTYHSSDGTLCTVQDLLDPVLRHFALSQDLLIIVLGQSDLFFFGVGTLRSLSPVIVPRLHCPKTVPRLHCPKTSLVLSQDWSPSVWIVGFLPLHCRDFLNNCTLYHHLSSGKKFSQKPFLNGQRLQKLTPLYLSPFRCFKQFETKKCSQVSCDHVKV